MSCPLCQGTDDAAECTAGRCAFQARIEEHGRRENERRAQDEADVVVNLGPPPNDEAAFTRTMTDGVGHTVTLELMPRTVFPEIGAQVGVRLTTKLPDGETSITNTIGLSDEDRVAFAEALISAGPQC